MKNVVLHGENQVESRKKLAFLASQARKKGLEVERLDGKVVGKGDLLMAARSQSLLSDDRLVIVENFFSGNNKAAGVVQELAKAGGAQFLFWEKTTLSPSTVKSLLGIVQVEEFKIPKSIFKFLDSLAPRNTKMMLGLLHDIKESRHGRKESEGDFVLSMLGRQVRLLIWAKLSPETLTLADWQRKRFISQAQKFTADQLFTFHARLLELDRMNKRSQLPEDLSASLDLLVVGL